MWHRVCDLHLSLRNWKFNRRVEYFKSFGRTEKGIWTLTHPINQNFLLPKEYVIHVLCTLGQLLVTFFGGWPSASTLHCKVCPNHQCVVRAAESCSYVLKAKDIASGGFINTFLPFIYHSFHLLLSNREKSFKYLSK